MSLILDALRKLERDREQKDPAVVVLGTAPWPGGGPSRRARWIVGCLAVAGVSSVLVVWLRRTPVPSPSPATPATAAMPAGAGPALPAAAPTAAQSGATAPAPFTARPTARRGDDLPPPARRLVAPDAAPAPAAEEPRPPTAAARDLQLMAISQRDGRPIAIVSDHVVREGDSFDDVKIIRIGETEVEVEQGGRRRVLRF